MLFVVADRGAADGEPVRAEFGMYTRRTRCDGGCGSKPAEVKREFQTRFSKGARTPLWNVFFSKPVDLSALESAVASLLARRLCGSSNRVNVPPPAPSRWAPISSKYWGASARSAQSGSPAIPNVQMPRKFHSVRDDQNRFIGEKPVRKHGRTGHAPLSVKPVTGTCFAKLLFRWLLKDRPKVGAECVQSGSSTMSLTSSR
jgi:hypothetical protein